ncbi:MAG TPA: SURF1 family protein [Roseiflexaceae bacterium]|nr:SURF1 family protein [Roseiflexaceae bacterium]HMP43332.1 SURF1 family protein [Roseiflexaceae bacterium]
MLIELFRGRRLVATLIILAGVIFLCRLGIWQLERHAQRLALNERIISGMAREPLVLEPDALPSIELLDYRQIAVRGVFDPSHEFLLRNRSFNGATGYHLITPFRLSGSTTAILVDRGWIPLTRASPAERTAFAPPPGEVLLVGIARRSQEATGRPQDPPLSSDRPRLDAWFRITIDRIQQQIPYPLLPVFVELQPDPNGIPVLPQPVATSDLGPGSHFGYAVQWFSFAFIFLVGYLIFSWRQLRSRTPS